MKGPLPIDLLKSQLGSIQDRSIKGESDQRQNLLKSRRDVIERFCFGVPFGASLLGDLELDRSLGLLLHHYGPVKYASALDEVFDSSTRQITTTEFAVDC